MSTKTTYLTVVTSDPKLSSELIEFFDKSERNGLIILNDSDPFQRIEEQDTLVEGMRQRAESAERALQRYELGVAGLVRFLTSKKPIRYDSNPSQAELAYEDVLNWVRENLSVNKGT